MINFLTRVNDRVSSRVILMAFWAFFWLFNGLDKFLNIGVIRKEGGSDHPLATPEYIHQGFFGVYRDEKFTMYFSRIFREDWGFPRWLPEFFAMSSVYVFGAIEILLGLSFFYILFTGNKAHPVINRVNFKLSMILFLLFSIGDIVFGDRTELWEHGTFLVLVIVSFEFFLFATRPEDAEVGLGGRILGTMINQKEIDQSGE